MQRLPSLKQHGAYNLAKSVGIGFGNCLVIAFYCSVVSQRKLLGVNKIAFSAVTTQFKHKTLEYLWS